MASRLPAVLSHLDLPEAELWAAHLDGEVYPLDECFSPIDEAELPGNRVRALGLILPRRTIAERLSAAWLHGVLPFPPAVHQLCADSRARVKPVRSRRFQVREVEITAEEIVACEGVQITTPLRTVMDLARFSDRFGPDERRLVRGLLALQGIGVEECCSAILARRNLPAKRLALRRVRACFED
ncbi:MAG TPA: type IV toxin-antitoxin system AbiEi family antitoxin [Microbacteriaceae bacterium]|jgi:hypothetical protein